MAEIKDFNKERAAREGKNHSYKDKISKYKMRNTYRAAIVFAIAIAIILVVYVQFKRHVYTDYDVIATVSRSVMTDSVDKRLDSAVLTYSKDGAHYTDTKGNITWNQTYQMQDMKVAVCGNTVAIGEYNGRRIITQKADKQISEIETNLPILDLTVSEEGYVTAILDGKSYTSINTYDPSGKAIFTGEAHMNESGYPAAINLSPDGEILGVAYWYVDAGVIKTDMAFYNFGDVGQNNNDCIVSAYSYTDLLIPYIQFIDNKTSFAVGDGRLILYSGNHVPVEEMTKLFEEEVQSVYYGSKYIALVFRSEDSDYFYRVDIYNAQAKNTDNFFVKSFYTDISYDDIVLTDDTFIIYNERECQINTYSGTEKYRGEFKKSVRLMIPLGKSYKYMLVTDDSIDTIQMK